MHKISYILLAVVLLAAGLIPPVSAQDGGSTRTVITPANADQVVELARFGRGTISKVAWSPDGKTIAVAGSLGVWLYDANNLIAEPRLLETPTEVSSLAFSPDGSQIAAGGDNAWAWNAETGERTVWFTVTIAEHLQRKVKGLAFSPNGSQLAITGDFDQLHILDLQSYEDSFALKYDDQTVYPVAVAFSPDGKLLACGTSSESDDVYGKLVLWNLETRTQIADIGRTTYHVLFTPDGRKIISAPFAPDQNLIIIWDIETGFSQETIPFSTNGGTLQVFDMALNAQGNLLAVATDNGVLLWDIQTDSQRDVLYPNHWIDSVAFNPDSTHIAYISRNTLYIRNLETGDEQAFSYSEPE